MASQINAKVLNTLLTNQIPVGITGAVLGGVAGEVLRNIIVDDPTSLMLVAGVSGIIKIVEVGYEYLAPRLFQKKQELCYPLQEVFRTAFREALIDLGGEDCFPEHWQHGARSWPVPDYIVYGKRVSVQNDLRWSRQAQDQQARNCFLKLVTALDQKEILPADPSSKESMQSVVTYLSRKDPQTLNHRFFDELIVPYVRDFKEHPVYAHLEQHLLKRTIEHLKHLLQLQQELAQPLGLLLMESLRDSIQEYGPQFREISGYLKEMLAHVNKLAAYLTITPPGAPVAPPDISLVIGRATELARYSQQLHSSGLALITGLPGIGKTTLAVTLKQQFEVDWPAFFWLECDRDSNWDAVVDGLAALLARHGQPKLWNARRVPTGTPISPNVTIDFLNESFQQAKYLLCFDNFHYVARDAKVQQLFTRLLLPQAQRGQLKLIVASRDRPKWAEQDCISLKGLNRHDTRQFLAARGIQLADELFDQLLDKTEGHPQWLNLATMAIQQSHNPGDLIARLWKARNVQDYLIEEVNQVLSRQEQVVMQTIALFLGDGIEQEMLESLHGQSVSNELYALTQKNLLVMIPEPSMERYQLHSILQDFFYGQIPAQQRQQLHRRAAMLYIDPPMEQSQRQLSVNRLRAAEHYLHANEYMLAATHATADPHSNINHGHTKLLRRLLTSLLRKPLDLRLRARVLLSLGDVAALMGDFKAAHRYFHDALNSSLSLPKDAKQDLRVRLYWRRALLYERQGQYTQAEQDCRTALQLIPRSGHVEEAAIRLQLVEALFRRYDLDACAEECRQGLARFQSQPRSLPILIEFKRWQAAIIGERREYTLAIAQLEAVLPDARLSGDKRLEAKILNTIGKYQGDLNRPEQAESLLQQSLELQDLVGDLVGRATTLLNLGRLRELTQGLDQGLVYYKQSHRIAKKIGHADLFARSANTIAAALIAQNKLVKAEGYLHAALPIFQSLGDPLTLADCLYRLGDIALARSRFAEAQQLGEQTLKVAPDALYRSVALRVIGEALHGQGQLQAATQKLEEALTLQEAEAYDRAFTLAALARLSWDQHTHAKAKHFARESYELAHREHIPQLEHAMKQFLAAGYS